MRNCVFSAESRRESDRTRPIGKIDVKNRAPAGRVVKTDLAVKPIDDLLDDAEPKAATAPLARVCGIGLGELLEDVGLEFVRHTMAMVPHGDTGILVSRLDRDGHLSAGRRKLDGVREEIGNGLHKPVGVCAHVDGYRRRVEPNSNVRTFGNRAICLDRLLDQRSDLDAIEIEDDLARFHFLDIENVIEQANEPLAISYMRS